jgi:hypothetical protein
MIEDSTRHLLFRLNPKIILNTERSPVSNVESLSRLMERSVSSESTPLPHRKS